MSDADGAVQECALAFDMLEHNKDVRLTCDTRTLARFLPIRYRYVRAAGGVVSSPDGRWLLMRRDGLWDLPKGMVEHGETLSAAALREVREETGVSARLAVPKPLLKTYHIYDKYGGWHLKQTTWFAMTALTDEPLTPQREEGIEQVAWTDRRQWEALLQSSFASLRQVSRILSEK